MAYWLFKSEPGAWSWDDHVKAKVAEWDGRKLTFTAKSPGGAALSGDCAILLQSVETGRILGAAKLALN